MNPIMLERAFESWCSYEGIPTNDATRHQFNERTDLVKWLRVAHTDIQLLRQAFMRFEGALTNRNTLIVPTVEGGSVSWRFNDEGMMEGRV